MTVVGAIIVNNSGELLLQQRDENAPSFKGCWTLFGGHVEPRETPMQAILRELHEELCLAPESVMSVKAVQTNIQENGTKQIIYRVQTDITMDQLVLSEGKAMAFVSVSQLFNRDFAFNIEQVLRTYLEHN